MSVQIFLVYKFLLNTNENIDLFNITSPSFCEGCLPSLIRRELRLLYRGGRKSGIKDKMFELNSLTSLVFFL